MLLVLGFAGLYFYVTSLQNALNDDRTRSDQSAYVNFAKRAYESSFQHTGYRSRMPLFPFVQALLYSPELDDEVFFAQGKQINIWLSVAAIASFAIAFFARFSRMYAGYAVLVTALLAFAFKAPYFQAEILYYTLFGFGFILSLETLVEPKWYKSIGAGIMFSLAHLSKASALPAVLLFTSSYGVLFIVKLVRSQLDQTLVRDVVMRVATPLLTFALVLYPYLQESKLKYGTYFYNVNTSFYLWYDSWDEAKAGTRAAGDRAGYPDLPEHEIPSLRKYLAEHSSEQIIGRFREGVTRLIAYGCYRRNSVHIYGYCSQVALGLFVLAIALPLLLRRFRWRKDHERIHVIWYAASLLILYALSAAWYMPISGNEGPRVVLVLLVPFLWTTGLVVHSKYIQSLNITVLGQSVKVVAIVYSLISLTLVYEIYQVVTWRAATMQGGK